MYNCLFKKPYYVIIAIEGHITYKYQYPLAWQDTSGKLKVRPTLIVFLSYLFLIWL